MASISKRGRAVSKVIKMARRVARRRFKTRRIPLRALPRSVIPEVKRFFDNSTTAQTLTTAAAGAYFNYNINNIAQGSDISNRTGDMVYSKSFYIKGMIQGSGGANFDSYRVDLIEDREPLNGGVAGGWPSIYNSAYTTNTDGINAMLNPSARQRFRIVKTIKGTLNTYLTSTTGPVVTPGVRHFKWYVKTNKKQRFNVTTASNPYWGVRYFIVAWSDVTTNTPVLWLNCEHRFTDA